MRLLKPILVTAIALCLSFPLASLSHRKPSAPTDYEIELARIQRDLSELEAGASAAPVDIDKALKFLHRLYHRASLTGSSTDFQAAEAAIDRALREMGPLTGLYLLKADLDFRLHRLEQADPALAALSRFAGDSRIVALKAEIGRAHV